MRALSSTAKAAGSLELSSRQGDVPAQQVAMLVVSCAASHFVLLCLLMVAPGQKACCACLFQLIQSAASGLVSSSSLVSAMAGGICLQQEGPAAGG